MADDIDHYSFDLEKEVDDLRRSLGSRADNVLFIEVQSQPSENGSPQFNLGYMAGDQATLSWIGDDIVRYFEANPEDSSQCINVTGGKRAVCLRDSELYTERLGAENQGLMRLFALYHETSHTQISGHALDDDHPFQECATDAYAALKFFQRFGRDAAPFLSLISWSRSIDAVLADTKHLSTTVLDRIIEDSAHRDFSKLTTDETLALARKYAQEWTPAPAAVSAARKILSQVGTINLYQLSQTCLASSNDLAFYIGAKLFQPFLQPEGVVINGRPLQLDEQTRVKYTALIKERSAGMHLRDLFSPAATERTEPEPPLADALKVQLPAGQKQLTIKP